MEHKIKLSYAVARAFWEFYGSDLMKARWTSEDIWFIPLDEEFASPDRIQLRAFVSFPFGNFREAPAEFCGEDQYLHRYPRILYLGIVLLEIGLGQSLGLERNSRPSLKAHINTTRSKAKAKLRELKDENWENFRWKTYLIRAIGNCLDSVNFKDTSMSQKSRYQGAKNGGTRASGALLEARTNALFRHVVTPLFWLASVGFEDPEEPPLAPLRKELRRQSTFTDNDELQQLWREKRDKPSFCLAVLAALMDS